MIDKLTLPDPTRNSVPANFVFDPDLIMSYDEQVEATIRRNHYQASPLPSFEGVHTANIMPKFNPSGVPDEEIYVRGVSLKKPGPFSSLHSELTGDTDKVEMWRVVERERVIDGTGLISSSILLDGSVGDLEEFDTVKHLTSNHTKRTTKPGAATPFISFSTDPVFLAHTVILRHGFGIKDGSDSVIVRVKVDPDRVVTHGRKKEEEVLLIGGVSPSEYIAAYEVSDFVTNVLPEDISVSMHDGEKLARDDALRFWTKLGGVALQ